MKTRKEYDSIGSINVPKDKYWGASTQRSKKFFNIGKIFVPNSMLTDPIIEGLVKAGWKPQS